MQQRKEFLLRHKIGVCDIVQSAKRKKVDASDLGMEQIELRNVVGYLKACPNVDTLLFMGGNSKNGPEYFFRRHLKEHGLALKMVSELVPRIHEFELPIDKGQKVDQNWSEVIVHGRGHRTIRTISLTAPSGAANRAVGSMGLYKKLKDENPHFSTLDFRVMQYREFF